MECVNAEPVAVLIFGWPHDRQCTGGIPRDFQRGLDLGYRGHNYEGPTEIKVVGRASFRELTRPIRANDEVTDQLDLFAT